MNEPESGDGAKSLIQVFTEEHVPVMIEKMTWRPFESILDYGCGDGSLGSKYLFRIAEKYSSALTCVDSSTDMIEYANKEHSHVLANFLLGDIMAEDTFKWPLHNSKYDKIICIHVVHLIQHYDEFFKRIAGHLQNGGQFACAIPYSKFHKIHQNLSEHPKWRKYMAIMKKVRASWSYDDSFDFPGSVTGVLESLGLKIIDFLAYETNYSFDSVNDFTDFVLATNLGTKNVPVELREELRQEISEQGAEIFKTSIRSKPFVITSKYLRFIVEK